MAYTYLISTGEFKELTGWSWQLDANWINAQMRTAQDLYIEPLLTEDLYDELVSEKSTNTLTTANQDLLDVVKPALAWRIAQDSVMAQSARVANIGVASNSGQNESASDQWANLRIDYQSKAESYSKRVVDFLDKNHDDYPLWPYSNCNTITGGSGGDTGIAYPNYMRRRVENIHRRRNN